VRGKSATGSRFQKKNDPKELQNGGKGEARAQKVSQGLLLRAGRSRETREENDSSAEGRRERKHISLRILEIEET